MKGRIPMNKSSRNAALNHFQDMNEYTDVLVIGGGPAGTWAAIHAAATGAKVILVDKGYCGTSGVTAPSGTGVWYVEPDKEKQQEAMKSRETLGGYLAEHKWMVSVLNKTYSNMHQLDSWKYPFPMEEGIKYYQSLQGPEYMRLMRKRVKKSSVKIWDHSRSLSC